MRILLKNCRIIDGINNYKGLLDILIADEKISRIDKHIDDVEAEKIIDVQGNIVAPGFIDMHCHLREPGFEYKETIESGSRAAAKGGYTTVCCMPNTKPAIDSIRMVRELRKRIYESSDIEIIPIGALTIGQRGLEICDFKAMTSDDVKFFSDDGYSIMDNAIMMECLRQSKLHDFLVIDHCEDMGLSKGGVINEGRISQKLGLKGIPKIAEELQVMRDVMLAEYTGASIHIAHISTEGSLDIIRWAKQRGVKVSCEVTPHHISLSEEDIIPSDTSFKVNPPLRTIEDVDALRKGLQDGMIDVIATDHAPHSDLDKPGDFYKAANGISGIELSFPVCYTYLVKEGLLTMEELIKKMSYNPSKLLGLSKGVIEKGRDSDLTVVDIESQFIVDRNQLVSKGKNTPFHGKKLWGETLMTISKGKVVYEKEGRFNVYR